MAFLDVHLNLFLLDKNDAKGGSSFCCFVVYSAHQPPLNTITIFQIHPDQPFEETVSWRAGDWERSAEPPRVKNRELGNKGHGATFTTTN